MTQKKRISELAKEYGIPGADLVKKLKDRGFTHVKGPASGLEDFEVMQIEAILQAEGRKRVGADGAASSADARSSQQLDTLARIADRLDEIAAMMREKR